MAPLYAKGHMRAPPAFAGSAVDHVLSPLMTWLRIERPRSWLQRGAAASRPLALATMLLAAPACKDKDPAPDPAALRAQQALIDRRDALLAARKRTQQERNQLQDELRKTVATGGDTGEMQRKLDALDSELEEQNDQLADELQTLASKISSIAVATDKTAGVAAREAEVGGREGRLTSREERVAAREKEVAQRERELLVRERETCSAPTTMIVQAPAPKGSSYSRRDIEALLTRARAAMGQRGILASDLPSYAQGLEREATRSMAEGDTGKAYLAATQLTATAEAVKIDKDFVKAKINRLQKQISAKGGKLDEETNKNLGAGISDVMQKWGDGEFAKANAKLNQLYASLR
jgi:DNA repair exonuclease SbcCD ATPase subunit